MNTDINIDTLKEMADYFENQLYKCTSVPKYMMCETTISPASLRDDYEGQLINDMLLL